MTFINYDDAKVNHRQERLRELTDRQLVAMHNQFEKWRYKSQEQHEMAADIQKEINRRNKQIFK